MRWHGWGWVATGVLMAGCSDQRPSDWWHMEEQLPEEQPVETFQATKPPPPLSGGTLLVTRDGRYAVAADSARDRVVVVDLDARHLAAEVPLVPGDEPGRIAEDDVGTVHVALRRGGAVVSIDPRSGQALDRRWACDAPRGIAYRESVDQLLVACAGGELVTMAASSRGRSDETKRHWLDTDLRDVVVVDDTVYVSRFRSAELLRLNADGSIAQRMAPSPITHPASGRRFVPAVAWRTVAGNDGTVLMLHQRATSNTVVVTPPTAGGDGMQQSSSYGSAPGGGNGSQALTVPTPCGEELVHSALTVFGGDGTKLLWTKSLNLGVGALAVDVALVPGSGHVAIDGVGVGVILDRYLSDLEQDLGCFVANSSDMQAGAGAHAVAFDALGSVVAWQPEPAAVRLRDGTSIAAGGESIRDTGWEMFHRGRAIACASCHPEGRDDGHVWTFENGPRRTQNLSGGVLGTEPFHWEGDMADLGALVIEVMQNRMGQGVQPPEHVDALAGWMSTLPTLRSTPRFDDPAAQRGRQLFEDATVGCAVCHAGALTTNNETVDVGTGMALQVPSLRGLGLRAPFMHDGCALDLRQRFDGPCGGGDVHGKTSHLSSAQLDDLVAYLERL